MIDAIFKTRQYFAKIMPLKHRLPYFVVDFSGPRYDFINYELCGKFVSNEIFVPGVESIHFADKRDDLYSHMKNYLNYEKPIVLTHRSGHRPVKILNWQ